MPPSPRGRHSCTANTDGGFGAPFSSWSNTNDDWKRENLKFVAGDFNADGRDDLGGLYGYSDGKVKMFTWTTRTDGKINGAAPGWTSATTTSWDINRGTVLRSAN
ncbi:hypothetical protein ACIHAA_04375 [Streptomyces sp. NPDC052040]|uniref:hypothetical protein n=1 Tax=Streptomyces sp. NPDC052040 TaxID=3365682 RepID=UPI0037D5083F